MAAKTECVLCRLPSIVGPVEMLPDSGVLFRAIHDQDGSIHTWTEYGSLESAVNHQGKRSNQRNPRIIVCPNCRKKGRVNYYHPDKRKDPAKIGYVVTHEELSGSWGRGRKKINRRRRCYITDAAQRAIVLRKLGRHIQDGTGQLTLSGFSQGD